MLKANAQVSAEGLFGALASFLVVATGIFLARESRPALLPDASLIAVAVIAAGFGARGGTPATLGAAALSTGAAVASYEIGGLAFLMSTALFLAAAIAPEIRTASRPVRLAVRLAIIVITVAWPITWIGVGLLLTPVILPLFLWAILPARKEAHDRPARSC